MKKLSILALLMVALFSCDKVTNVDFSQTSTSADFTIENGLQATDYKDSGVLNIDLNKIAQDNGTSLDLLKEVKLTSGKAIAEAGNFDKWDNLSVSIAADGQSNQNMMSKTPVVTPTGMELVMDVNSTTDFLPYFKGTNVKLVVTGKLKTATTEDQKVKFEIGYNVTAGL